MVTGVMKWHWRPPA